MEGKIVTHVEGVMVYVLFVIVSLLMCVGDRRVMEEPMEKYLAKKYRIPQKKQRNIYNKELEEWI